MVGASIPLAMITCFSEKRHTAAVSNDGLSFTEATILRAIIKLVVPTLTICQYFSTRNWPVWTHMKGEIRIRTHFRFPLIRYDLSKLNIWQATITVWSMTGNQENPFIHQSQVLCMSDKRLTTIIDELREFAVSIDKQGEYPCDHEYARCKRPKEDPVLPVSTCFWDERRGVTYHNDTDKLPFLVCPRVPMPYLGE
jgi:hypothetical protein